MENKYTIPSIVASLFFGLFTLKFRSYVKSIMNSDADRVLKTISEKLTLEILDKIVREHGGLRHTSWRFGNAFRKEDSFISEVCRLIVTGMKEDQ